MSTEKERESHVYLAKLAEQAERYDGESSLLTFFLIHLFFIRYWAIEFSFDLIEWLGFISFIFHAEKWP